METVPHVVLEYDKWSDCALVALTDSTSVSAAPRRITSTGAYTT